MKKVNILILVAFCGFAGAHRVACAAEPSSDVREHWLQLTAEHAEQITDDKAHDRDFIWSAIAIARAPRDRKQAILTVERIQDVEYRPECLGLIARQLCQRDFDDAMKFAASLPEESRDHVYFRILRNRVDNHAFAEAVTVVDRFSKKSDYSTEAWARIAEGQAKAGEYDAASASADKFAKLAADDPERVDELKELRELIAKYRDSKRKDPIRAEPKNLAARYRNVIGLFSDVEMDDSDLEKAKESADRMEGPMNQAAAWRRIAWLYFERKQLDASRQAMKKALAANMLVLVEDFQAMNYVQLADLCLELGDMEQARELIHKAQAKPDSLVQGFQSFLTGPSIVGVFVRSGDLDRAFQEIRSPKANSLIAYALGGFCAEAGHADEVEKRLEFAGSEVLKANLCLGVVDWLDMQEEAAAKKSQQQQKTQ